VIPDSEIETIEVRSSIPLPTRKDLYIPTIKWNLLISLKDLTSNHILHYLTMTTAMKLNRDRKRNFQKPPKKISDELAIDPSRITKIDQELEELKYIKVLRQTGHKKRYQLVKQNEKKTNLTSMYVPVIEWNYVYQLKNLSGKHFLVYLGIYTAMKLNRDTDQSYKPFPPEIREALGISSSRLGKITDKLKELNLIEVSKVSRTKMYKINLK